MRTLIDPDPNLKTYLIELAEYYHSRGEDLSVDLYAALMERGIDASQFNSSSNTNTEKE